MADDVIARSCSNDQPQTLFNSIASAEACLLTVRVIFLPIAERELRVTARKRSTFWVRVTGATVALVIGGGFFVLILVGPGFGATTMGRNLFGVLTWLCLAAVLSAGLFFTSDSLSEEKREGTLGFLFLTDLRGGDVVIGKLLAAGLRGLYGLLAVFPILGLTLLMGGVTGGAFFKTSLALLNALLASLVAGLFVSAISRDSHKALVATLALLGFWVAAGPVTDAILAGINQRPFNPVLSVSSPGYLFVIANSWGQTSFWWAMLANQFLVWTLVGLSCVLVPRTWQDKPAATMRRRHRGGSRRRTALRLKLLDVNPVTWLASLDRWPAIALWAVTVLAVGGVIAMFSASQRMLWLVSSYLGGVFSLIIYLFVASQAARFFVEARRSGVLELFLATPLTAQQIVQGQWRALLRIFGVPLVLFVAAHSVSNFMAQQQTWQMTAAATAAIPGPAPATNTMTATNIAIATTITNVPGTTAPAPVVAPPQLLILAISAAATLNTLTNLAALIWFGMWMGLTSKNTSLSTLKTMFWVQILPWFAVSFVAGILVSVLLIPGMIKKTPAAAPRAMVWFPLLSAAIGILLYLAKDVFFCLWARRKLYSEFRVRAAATIIPETSAAPIRGRGNR